MLALIIFALTVWVLIDAEHARRAEANWIIAQRFARRLESTDWTGDPGEIAALHDYADASINDQSDNAYRRYRRAVYQLRLAAHQYDDGSPQLLQAFQRVIEQLNIARANCPTFGPIYTFLGQLEYQHLDQPLGITHIQTGALLDLNDSTAWFAAGRSDAQRGRFDSANVKFRHALDLDYSQMDNITDFYLDELHEPQQAIHLAEGVPYRMRQVGNALMRRPEYAALGGEEYQRGEELDANNRPHAQ